LALLPSPGRKIRFHSVWQSNIDDPQTH